MAPTPFRRRRRTGMPRRLAMANAALAVATSRRGKKAAAGRARVFLALGAVLLAAAGGALFSRRRAASRARDAEGSPAGSGVAAATAPAPTPDAEGTVPPSAGAGFDERAEVEAAEDAAVAEDEPSVGDAGHVAAGASPDEPADRPTVIVPEDNRPAEGTTSERVPPGDDVVDITVRPEDGEGGGISGRPGARLDDVAETPGVPATGTPATPPETGDDDAQRKDDGEETWSGRAG